MTKLKTLEFWKKYNFFIILIVSTLTLFGLIQTYLSWPQSVKNDIQVLYDQNIKTEKAMETKADKKDMEAGFALIRKDIQRLEEKQEDTKSMIKFLYQKALTSK